MIQNTVQNTVQNTAPLPATERRPRLHLDYLDGLRGLAALYVVVFHIRVYHLNLAPALLHWTAPLGFGSDAVAVFIVLSGFCLMLPVARSEDGTLRGGAWRFFRSRARRILPPYYFAVGFSLLLIALFIGHKTGSPWDDSVPVTKLGLLSHLLLLQDVTRATWNQISPPLWSVSVEWRIYFCFPLLVLCWRRFGPWATTAAALALSWLLVFAFLFLPFVSRFNSQQNGVSPQFLGLFALGMLAAGISFSAHPALSRLRERLPWGRLTAAAFAVLVAANAVLPQALGTRPVWDCCAGLFAVCLLVAASRPGGWQAALSSRPLVSVGSFAYSLYLIHFPLVQMVWLFLIRPLHLGPAAGFALHLLLGVPVCVAVAYGFHLICERPFMSKPGQAAPKTERQAEAAAIESPAP